MKKYKATFYDFRDRTDRISVTINSTSIEKAKYEAQINTQAHYIFLDIVEVEE